MVFIVANDCIVDKATNLLSESISTFLVSRFNNKSTLTQFFIEACRRERRVFICFLIYSSSKFAQKLDKQNDFIFFQAM